MRVSIVTISFNQAAFLERAILSVLAQGHDDLEYIVVDPGSTDGSRDIIERYRHRIAHVVLTPDLGPADGLNHGFALATGDVLGYLNADDVLFPWAVVEVVEELEWDASADVICGDGYIIGADDQPLRRFRSTPFSVWRYVRGGATAMQQATFFRRRVFLEVGGFNVENHAHWDAELLIDLGLAGKRFKVVHRDWGLFRLHDESISGSPAASVRENVRRSRARLFEKAAGRPRARLDVIARAAARTQKWLLDPVGFWIRVGEKLGRRPRLPVRASPRAENGRSAGTLPPPSQRRLRVAVVSHAYVEPQIRKNIAALAAHADVHLISPRRWRVLVFDEGLDFGPRRKTERASTYRAVPLLSSYLLPTLTMGFRRFRPDVVHIEYDPWQVIFWQTVICRRIFAPRARLVCHVKKNTYRRLPGWRGVAKMAMARAGIARVDHFLAASEKVAAMYGTLFGVVEDRVDVVPHLAVDLEDFRPNGRRRGRDRVVIGYCGRLAAHKGLGELVKAVESARRESGVELELALLGCGPLSSWLEELRADRPWLSVSAAVPNREVAEFLSSLDVFVMPSRILEDHEEHDGHALVEALAAGVPAIGTRSGIVEEILRDGTGFLVAPGSPGELSRAITALALDPGLRDELSRRGRSAAERRFSLAVVAARKVEILQRVSV